MGSFTQVNRVANFQVACGDFITHLEDEFYDNKTIIEFLKDIKTNVFDALEQEPTEAHLDKIERVLRGKFDEFLAAKPALTAVRSSIMITDCFNRLFPQLKGVASSHCKGRENKVRFFIGGSPPSGASASDDESRSDSSASYVVR